MRVCIETTNSGGPLCGRFVKFVLDGDNEEGWLIFLIVLLGSLLLVIIFGLCFLYYRLAMPNHFKKDKKTESIELNGGTSTSIDTTNSTPLRRSEGQYLENCVNERRQSHPCQASEYERRTSQRRLRQQNENELDILDQTIKRFENGGHHPKATVMARNGDLIFVESGGKTETDTEELMCASPMKAPPATPTLNARLLPGASRWGGETGQQSSFFNFGYYTRASFKRH